MSLSRYKRLFLVLMLPLLLAGHLVFLLYMKDRVLDQILCEPVVVVSEYHCRYLGSVEDQTFKNAYGRHADWFDVETLTTGSNSPIQNMASASRQYLTGARILDAKVYPGASLEQEATVRTLIGRDVEIKLGFANSMSIFANTNILLACNRLTYLAEAGNYESVCRGPDRNIRVIFEVSGSSRQTLERLERAIDSEVAELRRDYRFDQLIIYPMFIYLFACLSISIFVVNRAIKYVKKG